MENFQQPQANREKKSPLIEVHLRLQENIKVASELLNRLQSIGNKLSDESANVNEMKAEPKLLEQELPGIVRDLNTDEAAISEVLSLINRQVKKIESII